MACHGGADTAPLAAQRETLDPGRCYLPSVKSDPLAGIARFARGRLGHAPTPVEPAPNLGAALGVEVWTKRDDCTGLVFGGNKVLQTRRHR